LAPQVALQVPDLQTMLQEALFGPHSQLPPFAHSTLHEGLRPSHVGLHLPPETHVRSHDAPAPHLQSPPFAHSPEQTEPASQLTPQVPSAQVNAQCAPAPHVHLPPFPQLESQSAPASHVALQVPTHVVVHFPQLAGQTTEELLATSVQQAFLSGQDSLVQTFAHTGPPVPVEPPVPVAPPVPIEPPVPSVPPAPPVEDAGSPLGAKRNGVVLHAVASARSKVAPAKLTAAHRTR